MDLRSGQHSFLMRWIGANRNTNASLTGAPRGVMNILVGKNQQQWRRNIRAYSRARFSNIYPGISIEYYENANRLEYDLMIAANTDSGTAVMSFPGANRITVEPDGDMVIESGSRHVRYRKPDAYQTIDGARRPVEASYAVRGQSVKFRLGPYDRSKPLVIDPVVQYATYLGGSGQDSATRVISDPEGNFYVGGVTASSDFPIYVRSSAASTLGRQDIFVAKFNADLELVYCTLFGSTLGDERLMAMNVHNGEPIIFGYSSPSGVPTTVGTLRQTCGSFCSSPFITRFGANGHSLVFSTLFPEGARMAVDESGEIYIAGQTLFTDPLLTQAPRGFQAGSALGSTPGFLAKLDASASKVEFVSLFENVIPSAITARHGKVFVAGSTSSRSLPVSADAVKSKFSGEQVYRSDDAGESWRSIDPGKGPLSTIAAGPDNTFYATMPRALLRSRDAGETWTELPFTPTQTGENEVLTGLLVDSMNANRLFGAGGRNLRRSDNGGETWTVLSDSICCPQGLAGESPLFFFTGSGRLPFALTSSDNGASWVPFQAIGNSGIGIQSINAAAVDPVRREAVLATNQGLITYPGRVALEGRTGPVAAVAIDASLPNRVYAQYIADLVFPFRIWRTDNSGRLWEPIRTPFWFAGLIGDRGTEALYGFGNGVVRSVDHGVTWHPLNHGRSNQSVSRLVIDGTTAGRMYALAGLPFDAYVMALSSDGETLQMATYFGGSGGESVAAMGVDAEGNIHLVGRTSSTDIPVTADAAQPEYSGEIDAYYAKLSPGGDRLLYGSFLGGHHEEDPVAITLHPAGGVVVAGSTQSGNFPLSTDAIEPSLGSFGLEGFVTWISREGTATYSSYAGSGLLALTDVAVDRRGRIALVGSSSSSELSTTGNAVQRAPSGASDAVFLLIEP